MSTILIDIDDKSSVKLFLDLAKKLSFKARVLTEAQKEDFALLAMIEERNNEPTLPIDGTLAILNKKKIK